MCNTSSHASDHWCLIWKESIQNCRSYRADTACGTDGWGETNIHPQQLHCTCIIKASLGWVTSPAGWPQFYSEFQPKKGQDACLVKIWWSRFRSVTSFHADKPNFPEFLMKKVKMTSKVKVYEFHFQYQLRVVCQDSCWVELWWFQLLCATNDRADQCQISWILKPKGQYDLEGLGQWSRFSIPAKHMPRCISLQMWCFHIKSLISYLMN